MLFIQGIVNIGMNLGVLPITGITLPLVSYGGSSILGITVGVTGTGWVLRVNKTIVTIKVDARRSTSRIFLYLFIILNQYNLGNITA